MKIFKKTAALILSIALIIVSVPISANVVTDTVSGSCGDNLTWSLAGGVLTISGSGEMYDYDTPVTTEDLGEIVSVDWLNQPPWYNETVTGIIIENGVTSIGAYAFNGLDYTFVVGDPYIDVECDCDLNPGSCMVHSEVNYTSGLEITYVTIPASVTVIGENAFFGL